MRTSACRCWARSSATDTAPATPAVGRCLPCPRCGELANVQLDLADLDTCCCRECDAEFTVAEVRALVAAWAPVVRWIDTFPSE